MIENSDEFTPQSLGEKLGKHLTHVDAQMREKTVEKLSNWMRDREKHVGIITPVELLQLWKGLYYTMWMTDKVALQQQMSDALSTLSQSFRRPDNVTGYFVAFFVTLQREWTSIDYLRLDKYLSLVRRMVHEWLLSLERRQWAADAVETFCTTLRDQVLLPRQADGLRMHVAFVYLAELRRVGGSTLEGSVLHELLAPFFCVLVAPPSETMFKATLDDVFVALCDKYAPAAPDASNEDKLERFQNADLGRVGAALFEIAADTQALSGQQRKQIYSLARRYKEAAGEDKSKVEAEEAEKTTNVTRPIKKTQEERPAKKAKTPAQAEPKTPAQAESKKGRRESGASESSTASQKSVRFSHADVVGIPKITRQMKQTPKVSAKEMGQPKKGLLKR